MPKIETYVKQHTQYHQGKFVCSLPSGAALCADDMQTLTALVTGFLFGYYMKEAKKMIYIKLIDTIDTLPNDVMRIESGALFDAGFHGVTHNSAWHGDVYYINEREQTLLEFEYRESDTQPDGFTPLDNVYFTEDGEFIDLTEFKADPLNAAVLAQVGDDCDTLINMAQNGADGGYSGFTYYNETCKFYDDNKALIIPALIESLQKCNSTLDDLTEWRYFGGSHLANIFLTVAGIDNDDVVTVKNVLAWFAAEHVARNFEQLSVHCLQLK